MKDLRIIGNRRLEDLILVDNAVLCFALQLTNGVPILPFFTDKQDDELVHLLYYLESIAECDDVRVRNREAFSLEEMLTNHEQQYSFLFENSMNFGDDEAYRTPDHGIDSNQDEQLLLQNLALNESITPRTSKA